jgi:2-amino-4-hydroxy-6-hydroxymethyldihydropteridine diphosphokinase
MNKVCLLIGTNLGDRVLNLEKSLKILKNKLGQIESISSIYETEAWGKTDQPSFFNLALILNTNYKPFEVLEITQDIEKVLGRIRKEKWGARIIDIDIIFFNDDIIESDRLIIPHPRLAERKFVLAPLQEIIPNYKHPIFNETIISLNRICTDKLNAKRLNIILTLNE